MEGKRASASMLIRATCAEVFDSFVEPKRLKQFWLADASAPLAAGAQVRWDFMVPGASETVTVTAFDRPHRLAYRWSEGLEVDTTFEEFAEGGTRVRVECRGFDEAQLVSQLAGTIEGFAIVLCDLKTLLETGRSAGLVRDKAALIMAAQARQGGG